MMDKIQDSVSRKMVRIMMITVVIVASFALACAFGVLDNSFGFGCIAVVCTFASKVVDIYLTQFFHRYSGRDPKRELGDHFL